jgi:hypothetical protein
MKQETFTEQEAIRLIEQTIQSVRKNVGENGFIFLLWGWMILLGYALSYALVILKNPNFIGYCWLVIGVLGFAISFIHYARKDKQSRVKNQIEKYFTYVWSGVGLGALIFYTYLILIQEWGLIAPFVLSMAGMGTFISGRIMKVRALVLGGISFWIGTAIALYFQNEWQFLIGGACMITGYLIPGYVLKFRYKKEQNA